MIELYWVAVFHMGLTGDIAIWRLQFAWQLALAVTWEFSWGCTLKCLVLLMYGIFILVEILTAWQLGSKWVKADLKSQFCILLVKASYGALPDSGRGEIDSTVL